MGPILGSDGGPPPAPVLGPNAELGCDLDPHLSILSKSPAFAHICQRLFNFDDHLATRQRGPKCGPQIAHLHC